MSYKLLWFKFLFDQMMLPNVVLNCNFFKILIKNENSDSTAKYSKQNVGFLNKKIVLH